MSINEVPKKNRAWKAVNLCLVVLVLVSGMYFLKSIDDLMMKSVELDQLKSDLKVIQNENKDMEEQKHYLESYENISSRLNELQMVKVSNIDYVNVTEDSLAKK